jgi:predicted aspartyl protease
MRIDTGFDGLLLIPYDLFLYLCRNIELFGEMQPIIEFPNDEILRCRAANVEIEIGNKLIDTQVWTYPECGEFLVGLELLNKFKILVNGSDKLIEIH